MKCFTLQGRYGRRIDVNSHVVPQHLYCPFCLFDFDAVARMEHFAEDAQFVTRALGMEVCATRHLS